MKILKRFIVLITIPFIGILSLGLTFIGAPIYWIFTGSNEFGECSLRLPYKYWDYMVK